MSLLDTIRDRWWTPDRAQSKQDGKADGVSGINWPLVLGQAAALISLVTALIYATGNLVLYARSWFQRYPWSSLLQEFSTIDLQVIGAGAAIPALIIGGIWAFCSESLRERWLTDPACSLPSVSAATPSTAEENDHLSTIRRRRFNLVFILTPLALVVALASLTPLSILIVTSQDANRDLFRPASECFLVPLIFGVLFYLIGLFMVGPILNLKSIAIRRVLVVAVTTLVSMPGVAGVAGTRPFPAALH